MEDFKVAGEWHFFATSHGKGPCDGIGGTLKRLARRASLQGTANIQTPESLYNWCHVNVTNIQSFYVPSSEIEETEKLLEKRFKSAKPIRGTQSFHSFIPVDAYSLEARVVSCSETFKSFVVIPPPTFLSVNYQDVRVNSVIAVAYEDGKWYLANVVEKNNAAFEFKVHFYKPSGEDSRTTGFKQSKEDDTAVVPIKNVIQITKSFMRTSRRARSFKIESTEREEIEIKFSNMMANGVDL